MFWYKLARQTETHTSKLAELSGKRCLRAVYVVETPNLRGYTAHSPEYLLLSEKKIATSCKDTACQT